MPNSLNRKYPKDMTFDKKNMNCVSRSDKIFEEKNKNWFQKWGLCFKETCNDKGCKCFHREAEKRSLTIKRSRQQNKKVADLYFRD